MTIDTISRRPVVGEVGVLAQFAAQGTLAGTEGRWYLASAPVSSKLPTLETLGTADRQKARLKVENDLGQFTPDVPGHYQVEHHDVTVVHVYQTYDGQVPTPDTDNDFGAAPVVDLSSGGAAGRYDFGYYAVVETISRTVGTAPNTITLALRVNDAVELRLPDAVTLAPAPSKIARIAAFDDSVLGIRDLIASGEVRSNKNTVVSSNTGRLALASIPVLEFLRQTWNGHLGAASSWAVHTNADNVNTVSATDVTDLTSAVARLIALRTAYEAHRASATFHAIVDNNTTVAIANPTDLASGIAFARQLFKAMIWGTFGGTDYSPWSGHFIGAGHASPGDPFGNYSFDWSSSLAGLLRVTNELTTRYNEHRLRTTLASPHTSADTNNGLRAYVDPDSSEAAIASWANALKDSIERHTADVYLNPATSQLVASVHHQNTRAIKIGKQASNMKSAVELIELCCVAYEQHAFDGGAAVSPVERSPAHAVAVLGSRNLPGPWPLVTRLQGHWQRATRMVVQRPPSNFNEAPPDLLRWGWD